MPTDPRERAEEMVSRVMPCNPMASHTLAVCMKTVDGEMLHVKACPGSLRPAVVDLVERLVETLQELSGLDCEDWSTGKDMLKHVRRVARGALSAAQEEDSDA